MSEQSTTFESLKLRPGQVLQVELDDYNQTRARTVLIGYLKNRAMLIATPVSNGLPVPLKPGAELTVRMFANLINAACAFHTKVQHTTAAPFPHLFVDIPEKLVVGEVRKSVRAQVQLDTSIMYSDAGKRKTVTAVIVDLSSAGARLTCPQINVEEGDDMDLVFTVDVNGLSRLLHLNATVRSVQLHEGSQRHYYGVQFNNIEDNDMISLHAYVLTHLHL